MKTILIVRHAKTHQADWGEKDFDRKLMKRGEKNAEEIAGFIRSKNLKPDLIICSPAKRTRQTAKILAKELAYKKDDIMFTDDLYEGSVSDYIRAISTAANKKNTLVIVGHNPGISMFSTIMSQEVFSGHMPTGSVVAVQAAVNDWSAFEAAEKELLFFQAPEGHLG